MGLGQGIPVAEKTYLFRILYIETIIMEGTLNR